MLGLTIDGKLVPMSPNLSKMRDGKIWFISAKGEEIVKNTSSSPSAGALSSLTRNPAFMPTSKAHYPMMPTKKSWARSGILLPLPGSRMTSRTPICA